MRRAFYSVYNQQTPPSSLGRLTIERKRRRYDDRSSNTLLHGLQEDFLIEIRMIVYDKIPLNDLKSKTKNRMVMRFGTSE